MVGEGAIIVTGMPFVGGLGCGTGASIVPIVKKNMQGLGRSG